MSMSSFLRSFTCLLVVAAVLSVGNSAFACATWKICNNSNGTCTLTAGFTLGTVPCLADGVSNVVNGTTAATICNDLKNTLNGDCTGCTFACVALDGGCWGLGEVTGCASCDTTTAAGGCGVTITRVP